MMGLLKREPLQGWTFSADLLKRFGVICVASKFRDARNRNSGMLRFGAFLFQA